MPASRIFISYVHTGDERGTEIASRIISDLRSNSVEVVTDDEQVPDENLVAFLNRELPRCQYFLFIQTPVTLRSLRVQTAVSAAFTLAAQQSIPRILRLIAATSEDNEAQSWWNTICTFDASVDYTRACAKLFLELDLIRLDDSSPSLIAISALSPETPAPHFTPLPTVTSSSDYNPPSTPPASFPGTTPAFSAPPVSASLSNTAPTFSAPPVPANLPNTTPTFSAPLISVGQPSAPLPPIGQNSGQLDLYGNGAPAPPPPSTPTSVPGDTWYQISGDNDQPVPLRRNGWLKYLALLPRSLKRVQTRAWQTFQAPTSAQPAGPPLQIALEDRPLPLNTSRRMAIRWASVITLIVILIAGTTVILAQGHNRPTSRPDTQMATATLSHPTPAPSATRRATRTPRPFPTQGIVVLKPDPRSTADAYANGSTLALNDTLVSNDSTYQWQVSSASTSGCQFKNTAYEQLATGLNTCVASKSNFSNFVYQIEIRIVQGTTAGILFRANSTKHTGYFFQITTAGDISLWRIDAATASPVQIPKTATLISAINKGPGQPNVIAVNVQGSHIECYVNKIPVIGVQDSTYASGSVGVVAGQGNANGQTEVAYQYAKVWTLP